MSELNPELNLGAPAKVTDDNRACYHLPVIFTRDTAVWADTSGLSPKVSPIMCRLHAGSYKLRVAACP